jgi:hypothetical protein
LDSLSAYLDGNMGRWLLFAALVLLLLLRLLRPRQTSAPNEVADPKKQLEFVSRVAFETQPLLNKGEFQVFLVLEEVVRQVGGGFRVMAQTCLGEFLRPRRQPQSDAAANDLAFRSINSKRVDFLIVDAAGLAVLVVEYQGDGHYQGTALMRDAVKREAFQSAGVTLIEVQPRFNRRELAGQVRGILVGHAKRPAASLFGGN